MAPLDSSHERIGFDCGMPAPIVASAQVICIEQLAVQSWAARCTACASDAGLARPLPSNTTATATLPGTADGKAGACSQKPPPGVV
ncbi:MAG TPA: hypothetical protein PLE72_05060 [Azospira sp.]|nr:hypothetical protein [Plasticicumulans sp.]HNJ76113.1 hypothetical protein [Azospira sp.]HNN45227.1 hypothetical protein [Azospira sp.]